MHKCLALSSSEGDFGGGLWGGLYLGGIAIYCVRLEWAAIAYASNQVNLAACLAEIAEKTISPKRLKIS